MGKKLSRNAPCPCGSGKKYKHCCIRKDFDWVEMDDGSLGRQIPLSHDAAAALENIREIQRQQYGREPDRIFEGAPPLEHLEHWTVEAMKAAGIEPALIYAYEKTNGLLLSTRNQNKVPDNEIAEWDAAIDEYESKTGLKAARRRLEERDLESILANGPTEHAQPQFVSRLPFPPPFAKEEWGKRHMSDIIHDPEYFEYFQRCITEITRSGRSEVYLNMFLVMAHLGGPRRSQVDYHQALKEAQLRNFSVPELRQALESLALTCEPKGAMPNAAAAFEVLAFIDQLMRSYTEHVGAAEELSDVLQRINALSLLAFVAAVNAELGLQPDIWKA